MDLLNFFWNQKLDKNSIEEFYPHPVSQIEKPKMIIKPTPKPKRIRKVKRLKDFIYY